MSPPPPADGCLAVPSGRALFGTAAHEELRDVVITSDGTILAAGYDRGTWTPHGLFGARGIVLELSPDLVAMSIAGVLDSTGTDSIESIAIAPETGAVWVAGRSNGELPQMPSRGGYDFVIGELSTAGLERRARGFESSSEYAHRVAVGPGGLLGVVGHEQAIDSIDPFLAVFDAADGSASPMWFTSRRDAANESYRAVDVSEELVAVGGDIADGAEAGMYVTAWDRDADRLWRRQLSPRALDLVTAVNILPSGQVLWAGTTGTLLGAEHHGGLDVVVGMLDGATGEPLWTVQHGSTGDERVTDVMVDASGRIAVVGDVEALTPDGPRGDVDAYVLVLDASGQPVLNEQWSSDGDDRPTGVAMDACGGVAIVGSSTGDLVGDARGGRDAFVLVTHVAD